MLVLELGSSVVLEKFVIKVYEPQYVVYLTTSGSKQETTN